MNGILLHLLLQEIRDKLIGLYIDGVYIQHRIVQVVCGNKALFISLYPQAPAVFFAKKIREHFEKIKPFSNEVKLSRITKIEQTNFMPVMRLALEKLVIDEQSASEIVISLYRDAPNFSIKAARTQKNLFSRYIVKPAKKSITELTTADLQSFQSKEGTKSKERLVGEVEGIDKYLASELTSENIKKLHRILSGEKVKPRLVSIVPLRISLFARDYIKEYSSLNRLLEDGIKRFIEERAKSLFAFRQKQLSRNVKRRIERLKKKLLNDNEIEQYRIAGELILTNSTRIRKGVAQVNLFNPYINKKVEIKLDSQKTPQENAQIYFSKYKKLKRGQPKINQKIEELKKEIVAIKAGAFTIPESGHFKPIVKKEKPLPFRTFELVSGSLVYVGKGAKSNQDLTFKFAKPNDYFFHIRGYEGAHAILKAKVPKAQKPQKNDIESAASIAAYYSKAKKQKNVAVSYTQRKYLKRDKRGKPGSVILMREEVIFVDPALPDGQAVDSKQ